MKPVISSLISRGYYMSDTSATTVAMSASVMNGSTLLHEEEVDIDALPITPEQPKKQRKLHSREKSDVR